MKIVDSLSMAEIDRTTIQKYGIPSQILMENAGLRIWHCFIQDYLQSQDLPLRQARSKKQLSLVFMAGKGNNGGDACVMARQALTDGFRGITLISWGSRLEDDNTGQKRYCKNLGIKVLQWEEQRASAEECISNADFIFDGLTGTGLEGRARPVLEEVITRVNGGGGVRIALDIPSGLGDGFRKGFPAVNADVTYTVGLPLLSLYRPAGREFCGRIVTVPICFPEALSGNADIPGELVTWEDVKDRLPSPSESDYKGKRGQLHIYAGSTGTSGAAWLAANAAARSMAGLVTLHIDEAVYPLVAGSYKAVMVRPWKMEETDSETSLAGPFLIGPGWGLDRPDERQDFIRKKMNKPGSQGVLDADGLTLFGRGKGFSPTGGRWIFTPHPGELARLTGLSTDEIMDNPLPVILDFAKKFEVLLLLKSHILYLAIPDGRFFIIDGMNPALGTGGSGDLLSGIIAGLLAAGASPEDAALTGTALHQEAGRLGREKFGWFAAEDLIPLVPKLMDEGGNNGGL